MADATDQVVDWRRHLHRHPEPSFHEVETARFVADTLAGFGDRLTIERPTETSVVARLDTGRPGPAVAPRAPLDAPPIEGQSGVEVPSPPARGMHACGHDRHTAMPLRAGRGLTA